MTVYRRAIGVNKHLVTGKGIIFGKTERPFRINDYKPSQQLFLLLNQFGTTVKANGVLMLVFILLFSLNSLILALKLLSRGHRHEGGTVRTAVMLFTWSNNSEAILVDGQLGQRQRVNMLPEGHKA